MRFGSVILALGIAGGLAYWFGIRPPGLDPAANAPVAASVVAEAPSATVETAAAPVPVMVLASQAEQTVSQLLVRGRTKANRNVAVQAETTGLIISEPLRRGTRVAAGDVLCELDPGTRPAQRAEAQAKLEEALAEAGAADKLTVKGFLAETTRIARQANLMSAQAAVELVDLDIERLKIHTPFGGILESDTAELGARLAPGDLCATVIDLSVVKAIGYVSEQAIDHLEIGQPARARLINGMEISGQITFISRMADEDTRTYEIEITLPNEAGRVRDGMTAELSIDLPAETAHRLPQSALTLDDDGRIGVRVAEGDTARFLPVQILRDTPDGMWVSGLPEQAGVIVVGQEFVRDGRKIAPVPIGWDELG